MNCLVEASARIEEFSPGQKVDTAFGPGVISAVSIIDSIVYVTLSNERSGLYVLRPEQISRLSNE